MHVWLSLSPVCQSCVLCLCQDDGAAAELLGAGRIFAADEHGGAGKTQRNKKPRTRNRALLGPTEEAKSGTQWRCCGHWCCVPGQVQEAIFLRWTWLTCHLAQRTIKNYQGTCEL